MKVLIAVLFLALAACTQRAADTSDTSDTSDAAEPKETVFDPLTETLDRARSVEDTILDSAAERRRQIDEQTSGR